MKRLMILFSAMLVAAAFAAPANAQLGCFKWVAFCDGIQVDTKSGCNLTGTWYNYDCATSWPGMIGSTCVSVPDLCGGGGGDAAMAARVSDGSPVGDWVFGIDTNFLGQLDGTVDMYSGFPPESCWIDELEYVFLSGACTGRGAENTPSSVQ